MRQILTLYCLTLFLINSASDSDFILYDIFSSASDSDFVLPDIISYKCASDSDFILYDIFK